MRKKLKISKEDKRRVGRGLDLAEKFLLEVVRHPERLKGIPSGAHIILYPVYDHSRSSSYFSYRA